MRIALLGPAPPFHGGIAGYLARLAERLGERGHDRVWISFRRQYPRLLYPGAAQSGGAAPWQVPASQPLFVAWSPRSWRASARALREAAPDVLVLKYWTPLFAPGFRAVARALRRCGVRVVYVVNNVEPHERMPLSTWLARAALREADGWIVHSDAVLRSLRERVGALDAQRVAHVDLPLLDFGVPGRERPSRDAARRALAIPAEARVALCFGYVRPYKGVATLIDAAGRLACAPGAPFRIYVVGEILGRRSPYLRRIRAAGAERVVQLVDRFVPDPEVEDWFAAADLVVLPHLSATQSGVERIAARYGLPVLASRVGGLAEAIAPRAPTRWVPAGDAAALAAALAEELARERSAVPVEEAAVAASWDAVCAALERLATRD